MTLEEAKRQAEHYGTQLHHLELSNDHRTRVAFACFAVAHQHHSAILILLDRETPLEATSFALLRPVMEATLRGEWVLHCATDDQVKTFALGGRRQLDIASVITALEACNPGSDALRILYHKNWKILSAYTHTYEHQVQHWLGEPGACPSYDASQIAWLLNASTSCFRMGISSIQSLALKSTADPQLGV